MNDETRKQDQAPAQEPAATGGPETAGQESAGQERAAGQGGGEGTGASADTAAAAGPDAGARDEARAAPPPAEPGVEQLRDQLLRALAEAENVRRRAQRDVAEARQFAIAGFARDVLGVADNFHRALAAVPEEEAARDPAVGSLIDGLRVTERELQNVLAKHGIEIFDPQGERFDPHMHQAMFEVENPEVPAGTVVQVVQQGARIGARVLRPALVGVSKGGAKPAPKADGGEPAAAAGETSGTEAPRD